VTSGTSSIPASVFHTNFLFFLFFRLILQVAGAYYIKLDDPVLEFEAKVEV